jgi:hypothetical protein
MDGRLSYCPVRSASTPARSSHRLRLRESPCAVKDFTCWEKESNRVVPALHDRQAIWDLAASNWMVTEPSGPFFAEESARAARRAASRPPGGQPFFRPVIAESDKALAEKLGLNAYGACCRPCRSFCTTEACGRRQGGAHGVQQAREPAHLRFSPT